MAKSGHTLGPISPPSNCHVGDASSTFRISPYVEQASPCYNLYHTGYNYETVVYVNNTKPYTRRVHIFGWRNGNRSSIPHTYGVTIPANSYTSSRVPTFGQEPVRYSSILVEVNNVFKQVGSNWVIDDDYRATCASIPVQNCYQETLPCHLTNTCDDDGDDPPTLF